MNEKILEDIGLTKGEIKVYLTLLKLGETTTGKIIEDSGLSSGKIYEILDKLINKGLASFIIKEKTKYFQASSPNRILDYLHEKEKDLKNKEEEFIKQLPSLLAIKEKTKKENENTLFKGLKGFRTAIYEALDSLNSKDEIIAMGITSTKDEKYNLMWQAWHKERIKRKIKCRAIFSDKKTNYYKALKKMKLIEVKVIEGITPTAVDVMDENVLILTHGKEPSCLLIKNAEIAQSFTTFFNSLWKIAKN
jgi:sugar-specific transcriptional regulator TrmB